MGVLSVSLLQDTPNPRSIALGSKAVAEPIMSLINGTYLALKKAIYASRSEFGSGSEFVPLHVPTTRVDPKCYRAFARAYSTHGFGAVMRGVSTCATLISIFLCTG